MYIIPNIINHYRRTGYITFGGQRKTLVSTFLNILRMGRITEGKPPKSEKSGCIILYRVI